MICQLDGILTACSPTTAIIKTPGGVSYECPISLRSYESLQSKANQEVSLLIQDVFREGIGTELFGFTDPEEKTLFNLLTKNVSGVGPKIAFAVLAHIPPNLFKEAIINNEPGVLSRVKGVGAKTAERIVLELRDKVGIAEAWQGMNSSEPNLAEALAALISLGHSKASAEKAVKAAADKVGKTSSETLIKEALRNL